MKVTQVYGWQGLKRVEIPSAAAGDIVAIAGIEDIGIGDTISGPGQSQTAARAAHRRADDRDDFQLQQLALGRARRRLVTSRKLRERLYHEQKKNVSLRIADTEQSDSFQVTGRGEFQLAIIIETMRREGYEMMVLQPDRGHPRRQRRSMNPIELLAIDIPEDFIGVVSQLLAMRKGKMTK